jgi:hypothetical protein
MHEEKMEIAFQWEKVISIKARCHNATVDDIAQIENLCSLYNNYFEKYSDKPFTRIGNVSACKIPQICGRVANFLFAQGLIDSKYARKLNETARKPVHKL